MLQAKVIALGISQANSAKKMNGLTGQATVRAKEPINVVRDDGEDIILQKFIAIHALECYKQHSTCYLQQEGYERSR